MPYINLKGFPVSPIAVALIPQDQAEKYKTVCFFYTGKEIRLGSLDPRLPAIKEIQDELYKEHHGNIKTYLISEPSFNLAFQLYDRIPKIRKITGGVEITEEDLLRYQHELGSFAELQKKINEINVTEMVTLIIASGIKSRSSDIHIEAEEQDVKVRFRIDGKLTLWLRYTEARTEAVSAVLKDRAKGLDRFERNMAQDGFAQMLIDGKTIRFRVSVLPTVGKELKRKEKR